MPSIARSTRQVKETATAFGGNNTRGPQLSSITPALNHAVGVVNQIGNQAIKWQEEADNTELTAFKTKLRNQQNKALHDKDNGFTHVKGKNAAESYGDYKDGYDKFVSTELGNLSSRLQDKAHLIGESHKVDLDNQLNVHTGREMENHADGVFKSGLESLKTNAVDNASVAPHKIRASIDEQNALVDTFAARKGLGAEEVKALKVNTASDVHTTVIAQMLNNGQDLAAKDYLKGVSDRGEISGLDAPKVSRMLRSSSIKGQSQRILGDVDPKLGYQESIAAIKSDPRSKDAEVQDAAVQRFKLSFQEEKTAKTYAENKYFQGLGDELMSDPENFELTSEDNAKLSFAQQKQLMATKSQMLNSKRGGKDKSDMVEYNRLMNLTSQELQGEKLALNGKLSYAHKQEFIDLQADGNKHKASQSMNSYVTKLVESADAEDDYEENQYIRAMFDRKLNTYPKDQQGKSETWNKINDEILLDVDVNWTPFSTPLWKARMKGKKILGPEDKPHKSVPKSAKFMDTMIGGVPVTGWVDEASGFVYSSKGKKIQKLTPIK